MAHLVVVLAVVIAWLMFGDEVRMT